MTILNEKKIVSKKLQNFTSIPELPPLHDDIFCFLFQKTNIFSEILWRSPKLTLMSSMSSVLAFIVVFKIEYSSGLTKARKKNSEVTMRSLAKKIPIVN